MPDAPTILLVDDEPSLVEAVGYSLRRDGYRVVVAATGPDALRLARAEHPALVVLDIMLPGLDGLQVCRTLRAESTVPILLLSAKGEAVDRIVGLELGADDYLAKPFAMRELLARVRAMLRRAAMPAAGAGIAEGDRDPGGSGAALFPAANVGSGAGIGAGGIQAGGWSGREEPGRGHAAAPLPARAAEPPVADAAIERAGLTVDPARRRAALHGVPLALKPKEFDLLHYFVRHPDLVHSRDALLRRVWGYEFPVDTRTVDVHVRWLRQKIEADPGRPRRIETVRGTGYRFVDAPDLTHP